MLTKVMVSSATAILPLALIALGNTLFVLCAALGYKRTSHEYFEEEVEDEETGIPHTGSVARFVHSRHLKSTKKNMGKTTDQRPKDTLAHKKEARGLEKAPADQDEVQVQDLEAAVARVSSTDTNSTRTSA